ncbi:MAG: phosphatase PAP2 family protein [Pseudomonadales bacterium]|nr:phosphatase PAP2 family protein [Pseudomonadales bacterium]
MDTFLHDLSWVLPLRSDAATVVFNAFTALGYLPFYLALLPLGYWLWDKAMFTRLAMLIMVSAVLNGFLKDLFNDPRPPLEFALDGRVGESFGLPSGHAQVAAVTWFWLALELRRATFWVLAAVIVAGVSFSRLYLGVHDVEDVLAGLALGIGSLLLFRWLLSTRFAAWHQLDGRIQLALILAVQPIVWLLWPAPGGPGAIGAIGAFIAGWWAGVVYDRHRLDFQRHPNWGRALIAAALGLIVLFLALGNLADPLLALGLGESAARWLQTLAMGLFVTAIAPWLFRRAGLAQ